MSHERLPDGDVTFLFTDMEGSTRLVQELGDDVFGEVLEQHERVLGAVWQAHGGRLFGTEGDACFVVFEDPGAALAAAAAAQRAVAAHRWPGNASARVRIGVHSGAGRVRNGDYWGVDVHYAARVCSAAHGGQVLVSEACRARATGVSATLEDVGEYALKDFDVPRRLLHLVVDGAGRDHFPPPRAQAGLKRTLPDPVTPLIGREAEIARLGEWLGSSDGGRIVTITGPGGTGKTRLAIGVGHALEPHFVDGVVYVTLAAVTDRGQVLPAIAAAAGLAESEDVATLAAQFGRRRVLLVVDNLEHLLSAGPLIAGLAAAAPRLRILGTCRVPLRVPGERLLPLGPLALAPENSRDRDVVTRSAAVTLLVERAREMDPGFVVDAGNAPVLAEICRRLGGMPLALELAAARLRVLDPDALLDRLRLSLDVLGRGHTDLPERQRGLRAVFDSTLQLLPPASRTVLAQLGVFVGPCTLEQAEAVCGEDALDGLVDLVDSALVRRVPGGRFTLPEALRAHVRELLDASDEAAGVRRRHAEVFAQEGLELYERAFLDVRGIREWSEDVVRELGPALEWSLKTDAQLHARCAAALVGPLFTLSRIRGLETLQDALREDTSTGAVIESGLALLAASRSDWSAAIAHADLAGARSRRAGDPPRLGFLARMLEVWMRMLGGAPDAALQRLTEVMADLEPNVDAAFAGYAQRTRAKALALTGRFEEADSLLSLSVIEGAGHDYPASVAGEWWVISAFNSGRYAECAERFRVALRHGHYLELSPYNRASLLQLLGLALAATSDPQLGLALAAAAEGVFRDLDHEEGTDETRSMLAVAHERGVQAIGPEAAAAARRRGESWSLDTAWQEALDALG